MKHLPIIILLMLSICVCQCTDKQDTLKPNNRVSIEKFIVNIPESSGNISSVIGSYSFLTERPLDSMINFLHNEGKIRKIREELLIHEDVHNFKANIIRDTLFFKLEKNVGPKGYDGKPVKQKDFLVAWNKSDFIYICKDSVEEKPVKLRINGDTMRMIKPKFFDLIEKWDTKKLLMHKYKRDTRHNIIPYQETIIYRVINNKFKVIVDSIKFDEIVLDRYESGGSNYLNCKYNELLNDYNLILSPYSVYRRVPD